MRKALILLSFIVLLFSCNADILMNNGEIVDTGHNRDEESSLPDNSFSGEAPKGVNATKSYYPEHIVVRWNAVQGADYYTLEKASHSSSSNSDVEWKTILETVNSTSYEDYDNLAPSTYYSYRVTAHTYSGDVSSVSSADTGTILASPVNIETSKGDSTTQINIIWDQMPNVESYKIFKSKNSAPTGSESEFIDIVNANISDIKNGYSYIIEDGEEGTELYFAIQGIGPTGKNAEISLPRVGYTFVEGAPLPPECNFITQGESKENIQIKFKSTDEEAVYVITRSAPGSAESEVYNSEYHGPLEKEDDYFVFIDNEVRPGVEYTYNITAKNDFGISKATTVIGFLLSPVSNVRLIPKENGDRIGYCVEFDLPVGSSYLKGNKEYTYRITPTLKSGFKQDSNVYSESEIKNIFFEVNKNVNEDSEKQEIRYIEVEAVNSENVYSDIAKSNSISDLSPQMGEITVSKNKKPAKKDKSNSNGVFPVYVSWKAIDGVGGYNIVITGSDGSTRNANSTTNSFIDDNAVSKPFVTYDYYVYALDSFGRYYELDDSTGKGGSLGSGGYGAISPEVYVRIFESVSLKPWERPEYLIDEHKKYWANSRIGELVGYGNSSDLNTQMQALDSAEDKDHYRNDSKITYRAAMEGIGGQIYFTYYRFGENADWYITGNYEMHVDAGGTGSAGSNTNGFVVDGMYPGKISLSSIRVSGKTFVGDYTGEMNYFNNESNSIRVKVPE